MQNILLFEKNISPYHNKHCLEHIENLFFMNSNMCSNHANFDSSPVIKKWLNRKGNNPKPLPVNFRELVPSLISPDRATHLIHPYPAKLLMHIPFFFLNNNILSNPDDIILDPFSGSGTVLLEAMLAGRHALGADVNPLARLITKVKTTPINQSVLKRAINNLLCRIGKSEPSEKPDVINLSYWFYPEVTIQLCKILGAIEKTKNQDIKDYFKVCFSNCVKRVSLADPRLSVPVRLKADQYSQNHPLRNKTETWLNELSKINVENVFKSILFANLKRFADFAEINLRLPNKAEVISSDARSLFYEFSNSHNNGNRLSDNSVKLIITSPPYPGAQKYIRSSCFGLGWLKICKPEDLISLKYETIGREEQLCGVYNKPIETSINSANEMLLKIWEKNKKRAAIAGVYLIEMREVLHECFRVLKTNGYFILVAANNYICGQEFKTVEYLKNLALDIGFSLCSILIDDIRSYGLMTKRNHTANIITREWILIFQK